MEIKETLSFPYTDSALYRFKAMCNANGYEIRETAIALEAWGYTDEEVAQQEVQAIAMLHLTRGDVFRGLLLAKGVTRAQLRAIIEQMPDTTPEQQVAKEYALIDFDEALEFYRGVALIDTVGEQLGITPDQMTAFFETGDWHNLQTQSENENQEEN